MEEAHSVPFLDQSARLNKSRAPLVSAAACQHGLESCPRHAVFPPKKCAKVTQKFLNGRAGGWGGCHTGRIPPLSSSAQSALLPSLEKVTFGILEDLSQLCLKLSSNDQGVETAVNRAFDFMDSRRELQTERCFLWMFPPQAPPGACSLSPRTPHETRRLDAYVCHLPGYLLRIASLGQKCPSFQ